MMNSECFPLIETILPMSDPLLSPASVTYSSARICVLDWAIKLETARHRLSRLFCLNFEHLCERLRGRLWIVDLADHQPCRGHPVSLTATAWDLAVLQLVQPLSTLTPSITVLDRLPLSFETAPLVVASILPGSENRFSRRGCGS